jgi:hypothetical protein
LNLLDQFVFQHITSLKICCGTLEYISWQIYKNLETVITDNCPVGPEADAVVREFIPKDRQRSRIICQKIIKG